MPRSRRGCSSWWHPFRGTVGIYVRNLKTGRYAAIRADEVFPTASMIKVPIMLTLFQQVQDGRLGWLDTLTYRDSLLYAGEDDLLGKLRDSTPVPLAQVAMLMITTSDNTASLWLQKLVGTGTAINAWLAEHGLDSTRVNSRTPGREDARTMLRLGTDDAARDGGAAGHDPGTARSEPRRRPGDVPDAHAHLLEW